MNRYRSGGPSKATPTTLCQKCLKRGHYTYECSAAQQERPYTSRPSRSQQLLNPKLAPKLSSQLPPDAKSDAVVLKTSKVGRSPDDQDRKRSHERPGGGREIMRGQSVSSRSSGSVSSDWTTRSRSPSRSISTIRRERPETRRARPCHQKMGRSRSPDEDHQRSRTDSDYRERASIENRRNSPLRRHHSRSLTPERKPYRSHISVPRRSRSTGRSPVHAQESRSREKTQRNTQPPRERSLSPYSQRLAMTRAKGAAGPGP